MRFAYTRLVTNDVQRLTAFYANLLGADPQGGGDYVELRPGGAILAIVSRQAAEQMHGGTWLPTPNRSAILEFEVADVDAERARIDGLICDWLQQPKNMPWGNRSMLFRDPDGNPINVFSPPPAHGQAED
ncbi:MULTISPECIES: VOC family protein [unclassified Bradyrhizobium]|uniref:VOC family protein n=1 Tax=unclassified Bradyrhizobium TaxID=2631580 RepID=UPI00211E04B3|nr:MULTISPECIES: VOC family protein [unclassified Bradyrhizobium]MDD1536978.1 glyoxalase [Bradyrhizobium sp. WBOS8]MDD1586518.1 glyoxalase [Bradyrhizobium sp. WBOS4]UUO48572.1 glyoxalase [Bradyrhizobium sp. WBOS04]UUO62391.1 glyoxalase [Bradyrhizobium sp. WBOS08]